MNNIISPGSTIGILGGGQLGRMLSLAASSMGYKTCVYSPHMGECAKSVTNLSITADYLDFAQLEIFAGMCDVVTFEFENIPFKCLEYLEGKSLVRPGAKVLRTTQNRILEKNFLVKSGVPTNKFYAVGSLDDLKNALKNLSLPAVLKTAESGYDGKGQVIIKSGTEADNAWHKLGGQPCVLEEFVNFEREISVIVARSPGGEVAVYHPVHNIHKNHILAETRQPAGIKQETAANAMDIAGTIAVELDLTGVLAVEMFVTEHGGILVNELAPRPHNSGHWTMDACVTSQFEQVVRAICNLPLGSTEVLCPAVMKNLIGEDANNWAGYYKNPRAIVHLYDKGEARPGRKMGHVTVISI